MGLLIERYTLTLNPDTIIWRWNSSGLFTTQSAYQLLVFRGVIDHNYTVWWSVHVPLKIKLFMWLTHHKKILTKDVLSKRGWLGATQCRLCAAEEIINHLFFQCSFVQDVWFWMGKCQKYHRNWGFMAWCLQGDFSDNIMWDLLVNLENEKYNYLQSSLL
jgi:zinc-binding in reverse transcriptase